MAVSNKFHNFAIDPERSKRGMDCSRLLLRGAVWGGVSPAVRVLVVCVTGLSPSCRLSQERRCAWSLCAASR